MKKMLLICAALMLVAAMAFAQAPAAPAATKAPDAKAAMDMAKPMMGVLTVDVAKKEASIKDGDKVTKLEFNKVVEDAAKLNGKKVEAKGAMKDMMFVATEIKEAPAAPAAK